MPPSHRSTPAPVPIRSRLIKNPSKPNLCMPTFAGIGSAPGIRTPGRGRAAVMRDAFSSDIGIDAIRDRPEADRHRPRAPPVVAGTCPTPTAPAPDLDQNPAATDILGARAGANSGRRRACTSSTSTRKQPRPIRHRVDADPNPSAIGCARHHRRRRPGRARQPPDGDRTPSAHARTDVRRERPQGTWQSNPSSNRQPLAGRGSP